MTNGPQTAGGLAGADAPAVPPGAGDASATQPAPPQAAPGKPPAIPTGFPEPAAPEPPRKLSASGNVILATVPPLGSVTLPPLDLGGETVTITPGGTEVDEATADRAYEAAHAGGYRLREL